MNTKFLDRLLANEHVAKAVVGSYVNMINMLTEPHTKIRFVHYKTKLKTSEELEESMVEIMDMLGTEFQEEISQKTDSHVYYVKEPTYRRVRAFPGSLTFYDRDLITSPTGVKERFNNSVLIRTINISNLGRESLCYLLDEDDNYYRKLIL